MEEEDDENAGFTIAGANTVEFTMDLGGATLGAYDDIKPCTGNPVGDGDLVDSCERISYARLDPDGDGVFGLYRNDVNEADNNEIITNVDALDFVYLDETRTVTAVLDEIGLVQACLVVRTTNEDLRYTNNEPYENINPLGPVQILGPQGDHFRRRVLCKEIKIRNAGL